ncbi:MAG: hypothetical protein JXR76_03815 [Deltaproteobacteria bacterium]|nr:hypothetical protein [Deltaproteobacteria bacterium]
MTNDTKSSALRHVRILVNRKSGFMWSFDKVQAAFDDFWDTPENDLLYQFCKDAKDGRTKARRAAAQGVDILLVVGGDGTISTTGAALIDSSTALGAIPMGSGNGFARHFGIALSPADAALDLATAEIKAIDVGCVNDRPFLATCSMAWDAAIVRTFQKSPVRGIFPYIVAGVHEFFNYTPQPINIVIDNNETLYIPDPLLFTVANLTQYGGDLKIASDAEPDDGCLELIIARKQDTPWLLGNVMNLTKSSLAELPKVVFRKFKHLRVEREKPDMIQIDGELVEAPAVVEVTVKPHCLKVLVPRQLDV